MSSPERSSVAPRGYPGPGYTIGGGYDDPYYAAYTPRTGAITPVIDEEARWISISYLCPNVLKKNNKKNIL